jgi:hypothetical protein
MMLLPHLVYKLANYIYVLLSIRGLASSIMVGAANYQSLGLHMTQRYPITFLYDNFSNVQVGS